MQSLFAILFLILDVVWFIVIAHVIMSWLINFNVLNRNQPLVWQIWTGLNRLLEPIYAPIRRVLPNNSAITRIVSGAEKSRTRSKRAWSSSWRASPVATPRMPCSRRATRLREKPWLASLRSAVCLGGSEPSSVSG